MTSSEHPPIQHGLPKPDETYQWCNQCGGYHARGYSDLDELDLEHDLGLRYLTDPFTGEWT
jgi:hypothetical protein